jgi:RHS repeat-associated protein
MKLWVNDIFREYPQNVDNDTKNISSVQMGILSPSSAGISGTVYFDDFVSTRIGDSYIGLDPNVTLPDYDQLLSNAFESGDLSAWSSAQTDSGNLSVTSAAAIEGNYGLQATADGQNELYVRNDLPMDATHYDARFYFNPNGVDIPSGEQLGLFRGVDFATGNVLEVRLQNVNGDYQLQALAYDDSGVPAATSWYTITDETHMVEVERWAASGPGANDGQLVFRLDDVPCEGLTSLDNDTQQIDHTELGMFSPSSADISGTIYFDDFASNRIGYIGPDGNVSMNALHHPLHKAIDVPQEQTTPTEVEASQTPAPSSTPTELEPSRTPAPSDTPTEVEPSQTPAPSDSPTEVEASQTPAPSDTPAPSGYIGLDGDLFMAAAWLLNPAHHVLQEQDEPTQQEPSSTSTPITTPTLSPTPLPSRTATPTYQPTATATSTPQRPPRTQPTQASPQKSKPNVITGRLPMTAETESQVGNWTISYTYDPLNRLTAADYSNGDYYHYTYDAVGNRLSQESSFNGVQLSTSYTYDAANRLTNAGGVDYTWDDNGNLLSDGVNTYTYDTANRLTAVNGQSATYSYAYNGLGDRLQQTVDGQTTTFTMDLNAGLTQVLSDGANTYLYGLDLVAQQNGADSEYVLGDALGSLRQLTNSAGDVTLTRSYDPFGNTLSSMGNEASAFSFAGQWQDAYIKLIDLRSRWYNSETGRFINKDTWQGDSNTPMSYNAWLYGYANPIMYMDPSGHKNCLFTSDYAACLNSALALKSKAQNYKGAVQSGNMKPVAAFARLASDAYSDFDHDILGTMWGLTNVLSGINPNDYISKTLAVVYPDLPVNKLPWATTDIDSAFIGMDWLPYKHDGCSDFPYPGGGQAKCSLIGDWNPEYFDKTANQAYHFWYYASSTFYDGALLPMLANLFHDPYFLEDQCGQDLVNWQKSKNPFLQFWANSTAGTSEEDFNLSLKGIEFGTQVKLSLYSGNLLPFDPGAWIADNLKK